MKIKLLTAAAGLAGFLAAAFSTVPVHAQNASTQTNTQSSQPTQQVQHVVRPGESLSMIASTTQTTYVRIFNANAVIVHPDLIHPGQALRIPAVNEQLPERPMPNAQAVRAQAVATPAPRPAPTVKTAAAPASKPAASPASAGVWDRLAKCESGGNWAINTGNGYYGGLQFTLGTWRGVGGAGYPHQASKAEQIARAQKLVERRGWSPWPACSAKLGLR